MQNDLPNFAECFPNRSLAYFNSREIMFNLCDFGGCPILVNRLEQNNLHPPLGKISVKHFI